MSVGFDGPTGALLKRSVELAAFHGSEASCIMQRIEQTAPVPASARTVHLLQTGISSPTGPLEPDFWADDL